MQNGTRILERGRITKGGGSLVSSGVKLPVGTRRSQPATSASCGRYDPLFAALVFSGSLLYRLLWLSGYSIVRED